MCIRDRPSADDTVSFYKDYDKDKQFFCEYVSGEDVRESEKTANEAESADGKTYNFGLYLDGSEKYTKSLGGLVKKPVIGITATSKHKEEAVQFIKWMMK